MTLLINSDRFKHDFDALAQIGSTGDGGVSRPALSEAHLEARRWWQARAREAGLETQVDSAGNVSAILQSPREASNSPTLLLGSHTDSVPNGGRFDGALGLLAALEVLRTVKDAGLRAGRLTPPSPVAPIWASVSKSCLKRLGLTRRVIVNSEKRQLPSKAYSPIYPNFFQF